MESILADGFAGWPALESESLLSDSALLDSSTAPKSLSISSRLGIGGKSSKATTCN
jgi:hypothetical protein